MVKYFPSFKLGYFRNNRVKLNFREPQRLYSRKVFSSFVAKKTDNAGSHGGAHGNDTDHSNGAPIMVGSKLVYLLMSLFCLIIALF